MKKSIATLLSLCLVLAGLMAVTDVASARSTKRGPRGHTGPRGLRGPAGPAGPQGPAGPAGRDAVGSGSITKIDFRGNEGTALKTLYDGNGLEVEAECTSDFVIRANATTDGNAISSYHITTTNDGSTDTNPFVVLYYDGSFNSEDNDRVESVGFANGSGHIDYAGSNGAAVTISNLISHNEGGAKYDCMFVGTAITSA